MRPGQKLGGSLLTTFCSDDPLKEKIQSICLAIISGKNVSKGSKTLADRNTKARHHGLDEIRPRIGSSDFDYLIVAISAQ